MQLLEIYVKIIYMGCKLSTGIIEEEEREVQVEEEEEREVHVEEEEPLTRGALFEKVGITCTHIIKKSVHTDFYLFADLFNAILYRPATLISKHVLKHDEFDPVFDFQTTSKQSTLESLLLFLKTARDVYTLQNLPISLDDFTIYFTDLYGIDAGGIRRNFIFNCVRDLKQQILEPIHHHSNIYQIKQGLDLKILKTRQLLFAFGWLIAVMIRNKLSFDFKLSLSLIETCVNHVKKPTPKQSKTMNTMNLIHNMIELPDDYIYIRHMLLKDEANGISSLGIDDLTTSNYINYFVKKHMLKTKGTNFIARGFQSTNVLHDCGGINIISLFDAICKPIISNTEFDDFRKNISFSFYSLSVDQEIEIIILKRGILILKSG